MLVLKHRENILLQELSHHIQFHTLTGENFILATVFHSLTLFRMLNRSDYKEHTQDICH